MSSRANDMMQQQLSDDPLNIPGPMETYGVQPPGVVPRRLRQADQNALVAQGEGVYLYKRFRITPVGMEIPADATEDELLEIGIILDSLETSIQWNIGDWFSRSERIWGQMYMSDPNAEGYAAAYLKYQTLRDYAWIARNVDLSIRKRQLSFSHHRTIAPFSQWPELQWHWLEYAEQNGLTVSAMKADVGMIANESAEAQIEILKNCLSQNARLAKKRPALPGGNGDPTKKIKGSARIIAKYWDHLGQLSGKQREQAIEAGLKQRELVNEYLRRLGIE